ncbi:hypothetical protein Patl1_04743 [Pistacia atlantica]|uniref:Uncharacterized protein n=1 Tax=Pistacia atlantica TaxID=434234 RepID=A0ACC1BTP1_9ROSI|nr:hypothetical protein Patl1_04743 [Pistacia atlantica]
MLVVSLPVLKLLPMYHSLFMNYLLLPYMDKPRDQVATILIKKSEARHCLLQFWTMDSLNNPSIRHQVNPETPATQLEEKWDKWLNKFQPDSGAYYVFGSQITQQNEQFQEMVLGFELSGFPFLVALTPPEG